MIVYYASEYQQPEHNNTVIPVQPPENVLHYLSNDYSTNNNYKTILKCPSFVEYYKNVYSIFPTYDYVLNFDGENFSSPNYHQKFFNNTVNIRVQQDGFLSYMDPPIVFFTEEKSLILEQLPPHVHNLDYDAQYLLGCYDIGKHLRRLEIPIKFKKPGSIVLKRDKPLYYVKFQTNKKITFKRFVFTYELQKLIDGVLSLRIFSHKSHNLNFFYDIIERYNYKSKYLKLIKNNLID